MKYFIGVDLGTSSVKTMLIGEKEIIKVVSKSYPIYYPQDGWTEQKPEEWLENTLAALKELTKDIDKKDVLSLSFSGQMHGLVVLDERDNVIRPAMLWNDGRTKKEVDYLNNEIGKNKLLKNTANIAFAGFTAPKLLWMYNNERKNFDKIKKIMLPKDYIAYKLTGKFATDVSDASGSLFFDTVNRTWSKPMMDILHISMEQLPEIFESDEPIGKLTPYYAELLGLPNLTVVIGGGDNAMSAIGTGTLDNGACNISLGTSGTILVISDKCEYDEKNAIHSFCSSNRKYHYLACILTAASGQKWWIEDILQGDYNTDNLLPYLDNKVYFLPYLMGERSPINDSEIRGSFLNLALNTTKEEMTVAVLEGVAFALRQNLDIIRSHGITISTSKICGGGAKNKLWLSMLATILDITIERPYYEHGGVLGGCLLGAKNILDAKSYEAMQKEFFKTAERIMPNPELKEYYDKKYQNFLAIYPTLKTLNF